MGERTRNWILGLLAAGAIGWILNGGASRLSNAATEVLSNSDFQLAGAEERALAAQPTVMAWLEPFRSKITSGQVAPELRGLAIVAFTEGVRSESLGTGTRTGCFYHQASHTAYVDVGFLAILDQLAMPRPDLTKAYVLCRVFAESVEPEARGVELDSLAGGIARRLGFVPPGAPGRNPALWRAAIQPGLGLSARVHEHLPPGWEFPLPDGVEAFEVRTAMMRAEAFLGGMAPLPAK